MTILPDWVQWFAALAPAAAALVTASAAVAVGIIAYRQWRVAREKLVLDLFDRRFTWYFEYKSELLKPLSNTRQSVVDAYLELSRLSEESRFLFGDEVLEMTTSTLTELQKVFFAIDVDARNSPDPAEPVRVAKDAYAKVVGPQFEQLRSALQPYMRMHQKL